MATSSAQARKHLATHLKSVITDAEELLKATAGNVGDKIQSIRSRVESTLSEAKDRLVDFEHDAVEKVQEGARTADKYVHENPWQSVGIAAGAGLILGLLLKHK